MRSGRPALLDQLDQDEYWVDGAGVAWELPKMSPGHRRALLSWLTRHAEKIKASAEWDFTFGGPSPSGDAASDLFDFAHTVLMEMSAAQWIEEQPLVIALRALDG